MITLKDIAREAGVSVMTVSRVVNNVPSRVSDAKRREIKDILDEMGYVPNAQARSLSSKCSKLVAIILPYSKNPLDYPYNAQMVGFMSVYIQDGGYTPLLYQVEDYREVTRRLRTWKVDGAIFLGLFDSNMKKLKEDNEIPLVFTDSYSPMRQITNVGLDDYKGGALAAEYLLSKGHRNIVFIAESSGDSPVVWARLKGFKQVLRDAGIALPERSLLTGLPSNEELLALCRSETPVTAFFAAADIIAIQLMRSLRENGISVPRECSVMGFDNMPICELCNPPLTTIGQDIERKARTAVDILFRHIDNPDSPSESIILDVCLIERESVGERRP